MTDRELLEAAAKAAGISVWTDIDGNHYSANGIGAAEQQWNPITDDGDALRLAVGLGISVLYSDFTGEAEARWNRGAYRLTEYGPDDPLAATRRAIVRAAAEIGRSKE